MPFSIPTYINLDDFRRRLLNALYAVFLPRTKSVTASATANTTDNVYLADATSASLTITLPDAIINKDQIVVVKKVDTSVNTVTIDGNGAQTIDGAATVVLSTQYHFRVMVSDGSNWHVIGS